MAKPNPLMQAYDAGMGLRNAISERLSHKRKPYVVCVTLFADMERDEAIEACVEGSQAKILWGAERRGQPAGGHRRRRLHRLPAHGLRSRGGVLAAGAGPGLPAPG